MEIVIEYALLDNFLIDMIILFVSSKLKHEKISVGRFVISSLFGAICAILMPLLQCANFLIIGIKFFIGFPGRSLATPCLSHNKNLRLRLEFQGKTFFIIALFYPFLNKFMEFLQGIFNSTDFINNSHFYSLFSH